MGCDNCNEKTNVPCDCDCPPGPKGDDGASFAWTETVLDPGEGGCAYGGIKLEGGPDINKDGVPDTITTTQYLCNGGPGLASAIEVLTQAPGAACTYGGLKIITGKDLDNDGIPDSDLVTSYVCNGAPGTNGATPTFQTGNTTALPAGSAPTSTVVPLGGNAYRIDIGVPIGSAGTPGSSLTSAMVVAGLNAPSCLATLGSITGFNAFMEAIMDEICLLKNNITGDPNSFNAIKTIQQDPILAVGTIDTLIAFEDDFTVLNGAHDNTNQHYQGVFVSDAIQSKRFVVEGVRVFQDAWAGGAQTVQLVIKRNGTVIASSTSYNIAVSGGGLDIYGNVFIPPSPGFVIPPLYTSILNLIVGETIEAYIRTANAGPVNMEIHAQGRFSNT